MKIGVFKGMPAEEYHAFRAANKSGLDAVLRSPLHYWAQFLDPMCEPRTETPSMRLGSAIHTATLEPDEFYKRYTIMPDDLDRRTKEGKAKHAELLATGKKVLSASEAHAAARVSSSVRQHPTAEHLFDDGDAETSIFWKDEETGVQCKARIDWLPRDYKFVIDLKSAQDARPREFARSCAVY